MPYRDAQAAIIAALADHSRPGHSGWQDQYQTGYWDVPTVSLIRNSLVGMEEVCGESAMVARNMGTLRDLHLAILIIRYETQFPSDRHRASLEYVTQESACNVTGLSNYRLRQEIVRSSLAPGKRKKVRPKYEELADRYGMHRNTVGTHYGKISAWVHQEFERGLAEITDKLEARGLIEGTPQESVQEPGMIEKLRSAWKIAAID